MSNFTFTHFFFLFLFPFLVKVTSCQNPSKTENATLAISGGLKIFLYCLLGLFVIFFILFLKYILKKAKKSPTTNKNQKSTQKKKSTDSASEDLLLPKSESEKELLKDTVPIDKTKTKKNGYSKLEETQKNESIQVGVVQIETIKSDKTGKNEPDLSELSLQEELDSKKEIVIVQVKETEIKTESESESEQEQEQEQEPEPEPEQEPEEPKIEKEETKKKIEKEQTEELKKETQKKIEIVQVKETEIKTEQESEQEKEEPKKEKEEPKIEQEETKKEIEKEQNEELKKESETFVEKETESEPEQEQEQEQEPEQEQETKEETKKETEREQTEELKIEITKEVKKEKEKETNKEKVKIIEKIQTEETIVEKTIKKLPELPLEITAMKCLEINCNNVIVSWEKPNKEEIEFYELELISLLTTNEQPLYFETTKNEFNFKKLIPGTEYQVRILSKNETGFSKKSKPFNFVSDLESPSKIFKQDIHILNIESRQIEFKWAGNDKKQKIDFYQINLFDANGNLYFKKETKETSIIMNKLKPNHEYSLMIRSHNVKGFSENSEKIKIKTLISNPEEIRDIKIKNIEKDTLFLEWENPEDNGSKIDYYRIEITRSIQKQKEKQQEIEIEIEKETEKETEKEIENKNEKKIIIELSETKTLVDGLIPQQKYTLQIMAHNKKGFSTKSKIQKFETKKGIIKKLNENDDQVLKLINVLPGQITKPNILKLTLNMVTISWEAFNDYKLQSNLIDFYKIQLNEYTSKMNNSWFQKPITEHFTTLNPMFSLTDLKPDTDYSINIQAHNSNGYGSLSKEIKFKTLKKKNSFKIKSKKEFKDEILIEIDYANNENENTDQDVLIYKVNYYKENEKETPFLIDFIQNKTKTLLLKKQENNCTIFIQTYDQKNQKYINDSKFYLHFKPMNQLKPKTIEDINLNKAINNNNYYYILKWETPKDNKLKNTHYEILLKDVNSNKTKTVISNTNSKKITGLKPLSKYVINIISINEYGKSKKSKDYEFTTESGKPNQIQNIKLITTENNLFKFDWEEPEDNGSKIDFYKIQLNEYTSKMNNSWFQKPITEHFTTLNPMFSLTDLKPDTDYSISIQAHNSNGYGYRSKEYKFKTKINVPNKITKIQINGITLTGIELSWLKPKNVEKIKKYKIELFDFQNKIKPLKYFVKEQPQLTIKDLLPNTKYFLQIQSSNSIGWSEISIPFHFKTLSDNPSPVTSIGKELLNAKKIRFFWDEPNNNGSKIQFYKVSIFKGNQKTNPHLIEFIQNNAFTFQCQNVNSNYKIIIQAYNEFGYSKITEKSQLIFATKQKISVPDKISNIKISNLSSTNCILEWDRPNENGSGITYYEITLINIKLNLKQKIISQDTSKKLIDLSPNKKYIINIISMNELGKSKKSKDYYFKTNPDKPDTIKFVECSLKTENAITLKIQRPNDNGSEIDYYQIKLFDEKENIEILNKNSESIIIKIDDLLPNNNYTAKIWAHNEYGNSPSAYVTRITTNPTLPKKINQIECINSTMDQLVLKWSNASQDDTIINYQLRYGEKSQDNNKFQKIFSSENTATLNNLLPNTEYWVQINSKNITGLSEFSEKKFFKTNAKLDSEQQKLEINNQTNEKEEK
ncbi:fibronectin type iii domain-containing 3ba-related [Anaeramoeba flamelloides]|uniref:Fibronectin type iii domain-containing 3ba-related n=1 Tax=Anaeramoeba flamelloides TaxID=1746091 RepID=A0ABQ8Z655_9EUKA|nr:fibronectin type iii domain-containing 3ba-related [Anaeramoeba flamelloides]